MSLTLSETPKTGFCRNVLVNIVQTWDIQGLASLQELVDIPMRDNFLRHQCDNPSNNYLYLASYKYFVLVLFLIMYIVKKHF